ncbi:MAG: rhodanese-like domain-containing protein [Sulfitobacter sp.]
MRQHNLISRRFLLGGIAAIAFCQDVVAQGIKVPVNGGNLTPPQAHALATSNKIILVDVRRPDEWATTGSGEGAHRLDLRRKDFVTAIDALVSGDKSAPIALICARGVRSNRTSKRLKKAGFTNIIDVPEGMLGSRSGPGWIKRNLPVVKG